MPVFFKSTVHRLALSVTASLILCGCHCALAAKFSAATICAAAQQGGLLTFLDPFNVIALSLFVYSLFSLDSGQSVAALRRKLSF